MGPSFTDYIVPSGFNEDYHLSDYREKIANVARKLETEENELILRILADNPRDLDSIQSLVSRVVNPSRDLVKELLEKTPPPLLAGNEKLRNEGLIAWLKQNLDHQKYSVQDDSKSLTPLYISRFSRSREDFSFYRYSTSKGASVTSL